MYTTSTNPTESHKQQQNKLFISLLNEIIKIHNCITVSNPFYHPWWLYAAFSVILCEMFKCRVRVRSFRWINKGKRCVFIVHDFIYHLNPLGRRENFLFTSSERMKVFKSLVKTHQFVKCTKVYSSRFDGGVLYQNQDCVGKNNIGRNYNINKINDLRDVYQFAKKREKKWFFVYIGKEKLWGAMNEKKKTAW